MDLSGVTRAGVTVPAAIDAAGVEGPTRADTRGTEWRRSSRGRYVPAYVDADLPEQRIVEAAATLPDGGAVTGWAGLRWCGGRWFTGTESDGVTPLPVPLAISDRRTVRPRSTTMLIQEWLAAGDVVAVDGLPVTVAVRSVTIAARRAATLTAAVEVIDMAAFSDLVSISELVRDAETHLVARPWARRLRSAIAHADENSWSPRESAMRIAWVKAGFPRPLCNPAIFDAGGSHLFTPDLFDPDAGVVGEYDGLIHLEDDRRARDLGREEIVKDLGLEVVTMVSGDSGAAFESRLAGAYRRARRRRADTWTLRRPSWWIDTSSVASRRALSDADRRRLLRRQAA